MSAFGLTLVTPSRDQRAYLLQNLGHVARLPGPLEHLVVDGSSTDGSVEILRAHQADADARGAAFAHLSEPDRGMYDALNKGFARARGDVLGYLNCDDLLLPWTVQRVLDRFDGEDRPDLVYGDALEWDPATGRAALVVQPPPWLLPGFLRAGGHLAQPAVFFRRELFERLGGFDTAYTLLGDHDLWLRALQAGARFATVDEVLAIQRVVEGQLMQRHARRVDAERARCFAQAGLAVPGPAARAGANAISAALHRIGLLRLWRRPGPAEERRGPWWQCARSGLIQQPSLTRGASSLVRSTRNRALLQLDLEVLARLCGVPDLARRGPT